MVDFQVARVAGEHELALHLFSVTLRRNARAQSGHAFEQRSEDALGDRRQHLLVAHVLDLVALEPPQ
ncbi:MAG: hypothetical protein E6G60_07385 [Actinobacteria bacterium]|nr:MAG: hypothetical protein E6G60_07385 [Actinomycetota bacterium]